MFELDAFVAGCQSALQEHTPELAVQELMAEIMSRPEELVAALGAPEGGGLHTLHRSAELTLLNIIWPPGIAFYPHNHNLWAVIGLYGGEEDNTFFNRDAQGTGLVRSGSQVLRTQDAIYLEKDAIHAVVNPRRGFTGAIHVYGGDFFSEPRSEWESESGQEAPYSVERAMQTFAEANERWLSHREGGG